ncbi:DUF6527 family protein [Paenibacillus sp. MBLB4367]|uniref:DUF6527 family protein n=1 Tax=Paenibacillus sp. MBLB4367 TaxID=3384767 RepID=UPI003907FEE0
MGAKVKEMSGGLWRFWCPGCNRAHAFDQRWTFNGNVNAPAFSPSLLCSAPYYGDMEPYVCHSFVTDGRIQFLSDCTHKLAGQTVELPVLAKIDED